jgi:lysophospholipase L1-like esterase
MTSLGREVTGGGSEDDGANTTAVATSDAPGSTSGNPPPGEGTGLDGDSSGTTAQGSSTGETPTVALDDVGTLVVLGDSISDGGGQGPYYYVRLRDDLDAFYGGIDYVNRAQSGSTTAALDDQIGGLPAQLTGPVAVVITSGGNDMKADLVPVITGFDGPLIAQMGANIDAALGMLLAPGRFGPGVEVHVFEGNVYDASDGVGDFGANDCNFGGGLPTFPTDAIFERWNDGIREAVEGRAQVAVDMHEYFYGHGFHASPNWYASDCTHPSSVGHDELHRLFYARITGEVAP